jgi:hypothetical protein
MAHIRLRWSRFRRFGGAIDPGAECGLQFKIHSVTVGYKIEKEKQPDPDFGAVPRILTFVIQIQSGSHFATTARSVFSRNPLPQNGQSRAAR